MSKFNCCFRNLMNTDASHAWIELHRCVEANAGTTGETFNSIFKRIEAEFNIDRAVKRKWPTLSQIHLIALKLKKEREAHLILLNELIAERRLEKKKGKRFSTHPQFNELTHKQSNHKIPKTGYWGWQDRRINGVESEEN